MSDPLEQYTQAFWDQRYRTSTRIWSGNPNPQLVAEVAGLPPGRALDAGCGEGADAHWLAARGWRVTALDVSAVALQRGAARADPEYADRISWRQADLLVWEPSAEDRYDLVSAQFMHFPSVLRTPSFGRLTDAVQTGGSPPIVGHHPSDLQTSAHRDHEPDRFFTAEQVAATLPADRWDVLVTDSRPRSAVDPDGREITIADAVLHARRRG